MIDDDDLALLATSFEAAVVQAGSAAVADRAVHELGWTDLLEAAPSRGAAAAFGVLGRAGSPACLLDDVVCHGLGLPLGVDHCVVLPTPHLATPPGLRRGAVLEVHGLVSARIDIATRVFLPIAADGGIDVVEIDPALVRNRLHDSLDPDRPYRRAVATSMVADARPVDAAGSWPVAVAAARAALAHQLVAASRQALELARQHAVDRVQFGRAIASFQAVRHKLAEALVAIEAAAAVADACGDGADPLLSTLAKSLAGKAARLTATNAQQVLAGIGFTTDHSFHLSLKRVLVLDTLFGSARTLPTELGMALLAQRGAPRLIEL